MNAAFKSGSDDDAITDETQLSASGASVAFALVKCFFANKGNADKAQVHIHRTWLQWHDTEKKHTQR